MTIQIDVRSIRTALFNDGYLVLRQAIPRTMCVAVLDALAAELDIGVDDPESWDLVSKEIEQVPMWGHQSQWDIRQLPELHAVWSAIWGTTDLWTARDSCRFTPPWREGRAEPLPLHWDADPRDTTVQWYQGIVALTDAPLGAGGFQCAPSVMRNAERWPTAWITTSYGTEYRPDPVPDEDVVQVPLEAGDLLIFDSHLPHGTVRNLRDTPRVAFFLQMFPAGTPEESETIVSDHLAGLAPPWWRWKPGHDRTEPWPPARLTDLGRSLLGLPKEQT